ncbi:uncharacterized protein LOC130810044 [Amaranthus tricolor]|uniref:uncharacterized protein LOC130810044 n=1 Tax=Amaranthus tricolor TaxID=29722 RepID=UPI002586910C|nr:uncharacterized protein LOC130810044 [Amaranthus tricolor]
MDLCSVRVKFNNPSAILARNSFLEKSGFGSFNLSRNSQFLVEDFEIRVSKRKNSNSYVNGYQCNKNSFIIKAMAKKNPDNFSSSPGNGGHSNSGGNGPKRNNSSDGKKSNDNASQKPHHVTRDWREFRATLFAREQVESINSNNHDQDGSQMESKPLGVKWAHPISLPEAGSVLVATEKLDGVRTFERTVVLLLRTGTRHPEQGPFGVILNRPHHKKIKQMKPHNLELATTFADCSLHYGGPLEASMFLLKTGGKPKLPEFEEVIPGLCFGSRNSLDEAMSLVKKGVLKSEDFRFFVGYAGWQLDQLREEIVSNYWHVAACSTNLLLGDSSQGLWEEILQLMGGQYSELSRKPKKDM